MSNKVQDDIPFQRETVEPIDSIDPIAPVDVSIDIAVGQKILAWACQILQEAEGHVAPHATFLERKRPHRYMCYATAMIHIIDFDPSCYEEASSQPIWRDSMMDEYQSIMKNDVWDIVPRPKGKFVVNSKWIYKIKHIVNMSMERHKMRSVARGFSQVEGIDYETIAPLARYTFIWMIISTATSMGWRVHQMDVNTTFLNGEIEEEVYIE
jgi:hypothetical protein